MNNTRYKDTINGQYYAFVLGYDLLQNELKAAGIACNEAHIICAEIIDMFSRSSYILDKSMSAYEALAKYVDHYKAAHIRFITTGEKKYLQ